MWAQLLQNVKPLVSSLVENIGDFTGKTNGIRPYCMTNFDYDNNNNDNNSDNNSNSSNNNNNNNYVDNNNNK